MGIFYFIHSVALIEDLPLEVHYPTPKEFYAAADAAYSQVILRLIFFASDDKYRVIVINIYNMHCLIIHITIKV